MSEGAATIPLYLEYIATTDPAPPARDAQVEVLFNVPTVTFNISSSAADVALDDGYAVHVHNVFVNVNVADAADKADKPEAVQVTLHLKAYVPTADKVPVVYAAVVAPVIFAYAPALKDCCH